MHPSTNLSHLRHDKKYKDRESFGGNMYCHQRHKNEDRHQDSEYNQGQVNKPDIYNRQNKEEDYSCKDCDY